VHGDGHNTRDFVYVDDVVSALILASKITNPQELVINIGSGIETSVQEFWIWQSRLPAQNPKSFITNVVSVDRIECVLI
jgi:UDP-glucose 4-epimerase